MIPAAVTDYSLDGLRSLFRKSMTALLICHKIHIYPFEEYGFAANKSKLDIVPYPY
jgi:hypothetical protein